MTEGRHERWTRNHAALVCLAALGSVLLGACWPAVLCGALSILAHTASELARQAEPRRLGAANAITILRVALLFVFAVLVQAPPGPAAALLALLIFALDGLDGWIARRTGTTSELGARLDMESDALLVLAATLALFVHGRLGAFILVPGLLRYGYVLALAMFAALRREAPRSKLGRYIFSLMMVSLIASLWPLPYHAPLALVASLAIVASFARSIAWSLRAR